MTRRSAAPEPTPHAAFTDALDALIAQVKEDRSIIAALLGGSLAYDAVWARSDIDLVLITIDDRKLDTPSLSLFADGVNVHALLLPRAEFRKIADGAIRNSFMHSFLAKGRLLYTHDSTIADLCARLGEIGERDTRMQMLRAANEALPALYKAHKFLATRGDLDYTALWMLHAASSLARLAVVSARQLADREVIQQALKIDPAFFKVIYTDMLNAKKTTRSVAGALQAIDDWLAARAPDVFAPVIDHLRDAGEIRSCTEIENHFSRNFGIGGVTTACEYLADLGLIGKASVSIRLTKRSNVDVQELAFFHLEP